jgi:hypothetical protein
MDIYNMLGVKPTSSLKEVKKAYIDMARMCHPDKGGNADDMRILKDSYDWICVQLQQVSLEASKGTYEEREADYQTYMEKQKEERLNTPLPTMTEIEQSVHITTVNAHTYAQLKSRIYTRFPHTNDTFLRDICMKRAYFYRENESEMLSKLDYILDDVEALNNEACIHHPSSIPGGYGAMLDASTIANSESSKTTDRTASTLPLHL